MSDNAHTLLLFQSGDAKQRSYFYEDAMKRSSLLTPVCHAEPASWVIQRGGGRVGPKLNRMYFNFFCNLKEENILDSLGYSVRPEG